MCCTQRWSGLWSLCIWPLSIFPLHKVHMWARKTLQCGMALYLLSEILTLVLLFAIIIIFNISFTNGNVNCFIFYAQILDVVDIDAKGSIEFVPSIKILQYIPKFIYRILSLDFFTLEQLSFCLCMERCYSNRYDDNEVCNCWHCSCSSTDDHPLVPVQMHTFSHSQMCSDTESLGLCCTVLLELHCTF